MRILDATATREALPFSRVIPALREMFAAGCSAPARSVHEIANPAGEAMTSLIMPAWTEGRYYGVKIINIAPGNASLGLPGLHSTYVLHDAKTGVPLALIDGDEITARRTAATSALAASYLARPDARHLLVVGAGRIARLLPEAYRAALPIDRVSIWARRHEQTRALADALRVAGIDADAVIDLDAAVARADIVSCATLAREPVVRGRYLSPASHLDLIGSFTPQMREADDECFAGAAIYVDTDEALRKSGDLLGPMSRGVFAAKDVHGTLAQLARGDVDGRPTATAQRTLFKAVGSALADLAAATLAFDESATAPTFDDKSETALAFDK